MEVKQKLGAGPFQSLAKSSQRSFLAGIGDTVACQDVEA
jgi:hypothetical protein